MNGQFLHNLLLFGRVLRQLGLDVNPGRMMDLVSALDHIEIGQKSDFFFAARTLLVHEREDLPLFDQAFALFWRKPSENWDRTWQGLIKRRKPPGPIVTHPHLKEAAQKENDPTSSSAEPMTIIEVTRSRVESLDYLSTGHLLARPDAWS